MANSKKIWAGYKSRCSAGVNLTPQDQDGVLNTGNAFAFYGYNTLQNIAKKFNYMWVGNADLQTTDRQQTTDNRRNCDDIIIIIIIIWRFVIAPITVKNIGAWQCTCGKKGYAKLRENNIVLSSRLKTEIDDSCLVCSGSWFHAAGPECENARSPNFVRTMWLFGIVFSTVCLWVCGCLVLFSVVSVCGCVGLWYCFQ